MGKCPWVDGWIDRIDEAEGQEVGQTKPAAPSAAPTPSSHSRWMRVRQTTTAPTAQTGVKTGTTATVQTPVGTVQTGVNTNVNAAAKAPVTVGGAPMLPTATIVANASKASNLTTLVKAVQAADLTATLSGPGPFTVFAPTDEAFGRLAPGTLDQLMKPEQKASLAKLLTYHVVAGTMTSQQIAAAIKAGGGKATLTTVQGEPLTASMMGRTLMLTDAKGGTSHVTIKDVMQSNGVIHVVDTVLMP